MRVRIEAGGIAELAADTIVIPITRAGEAPTRLPQGLAAIDRRMEGRLGDAVASGDFAAGAGDRLVVYGPRGGDLVRCVLLGLGEADKVDARAIRMLGGRVGREAVRDGAGRLALVVPPGKGLSAQHTATILAEGALLGAYRFDRYRRTSSRAAKGDGSGRRAARAKTSPSLRIAYTRRVQDLAVLRAAVRRAVEIAESQTEARDLSNEPPNHLFPDRLAREARRMAREVGLGCRVLVPADLKRLRMGAILAVGQGSEHPPRMVVLEHGATAARRKRGTLALVGKGITFDSGGLSIKPAMGMPDMKHDMSGAAAVFGAMRAIARLDLPIHVVGILAVAENMPSGKAYRPSDIIESASGHTIEITNTDAEGRLVLADGLHYAIKTYHPNAVVDVATLTGAAMVAFGPWATAALGNDEGLLEEMREAGEHVGETVWPMPLFPEHSRMMKSKVADLVNSGGRDAGISTAGAFLKAFVGDTPWLHLDIAGSGMTSSQTPIHIGGGTGVGVRMLTQWVRSRCD